MDKNVNFSNLTNAEINIKKMSYENEYNIKKDKIIALVKDLEELDNLYNMAVAELKKRGVLSDE